jgi:metal-responsive CopG/Arc/MetJ family transcriptional regulator
MRVKTSVTLSKELLNAISAETGGSNRSAFIEETTWSYLRLTARRVRDQVERDRINANADDLNAGALDALEYQDDE